MSHFLHLPGNIDYDIVTKYKPALPLPLVVSHGVYHHGAPVLAGVDGGGGRAELSGSSSTQCGIKHPSIILGITILVDPPHLMPRNTDENVL